MLDVAIGIVASGRQVLISRRRADVRLGGYWEFPGGKMHLGETPHNCVVRELLEEVGLTVRVLRSFPAIEYSYSTGPVRLHSFLCEAISGQAAALAAEEVRWVDVADLPNYRFPPANDELLMELARILSRQ